MNLRILSDDLDDLDDLLLYNEVLTKERITGRLDPNLVNKISSLSYT